MAVTAVGSGAQWVAALMPARTCNQWHRDLSILGLGFKKLIFRHFVRFRLVPAQITEDSIRSNIVWRTLHSA
jgi:hypothetical protein